MTVALKDLRERGVRGKEEYITGIVLPAPERAIVPLMEKRE